MCVKKRGKVDNFNQKNWILQEFVSIIYELDYFKILNKTEPFESTLLGVRGIKINVLRVVGKFKVLINRYI